nr:MAG TPA: hypothetical protein [Bacteriophage sp.]
MEFQLKTAQISTINPLTISLSENNISLRYAPLEFVLEHNFYIPYILILICLQFSSKLM